MISVMQYEAKKYYFNVTNKRYTTSDGYEIKPILVTVSLFDHLKHFLFNRHWSYGQKYCVVCGKDKA